MNRVAGWHWQLSDVEPSKTGSWRKLLVSGLDSDCLDVAAKARFLDQVELESRNVEACKSLLVIIG